MISEEELNRLIGLEIKYEVTFSDDTSRYEYGRIVEAWYDEELDIVDCRVKFYENWNAKDKGNLMPGTLRYWIGSLIPIDSDGNEIKLENGFYPAQPDV